jgi:hypothetical protein
VFTENSQNPGTSNGLIGALVALIGALSAYVLKLKAAVSRKTGKPVSIEEAVRNVVQEEMKKAPWAEPMRVVVAETVAHELKTSEAFKSVNRRLEALELGREEDRDRISSEFNELKRHLSALKGH